MVMTSPFNRNIHASSCSAAFVRVALVRRLSCDPERLGDLRPGPSLLNCARHRGAFQLLGQAAEGDHRRERFSGIVGRGDLEDVIHAVNSR